MLTPERLRAPSASRRCEIGVWIVTVAEPIGEPPWDAVSVTVSSASSSWSTEAASAAVTEDAPAASVSVAGIPV